uniref:hypothetical protein n=1 Tax=Acetatifactor sp. TaxID=1872090 RepID=UPI004057AC1C
MLEELKHFIDNIFLLPEIDFVKVRDVVIKRNEKKMDTIHEAMDKSYHDCYSDIDLSVVVRISSKDIVTPQEYMKRIERFGINTDSYLGFCFVPENNMYRIILKNGMRYDFGFEFVYDDNADSIVLQPKTEEYNNPNWSLENINRFWFVQIQALGKLYRKDFLISNHLANMNLNETLVQQMVLRDIKYETNHHRYGYEEEFIYVKNKNKCPIKSGNDSFDMIADKLYCASLTYDELTLLFYPEFKTRSLDFFEIWKCYEQGRIKQLNKV